MSRPETKTQTTPEQGTKLVLLGGGSYDNVAWPMLKFGMSLSKKREPNVLIRKNLKKP